MPVLSTPTSSAPAVTLTFTAPELSQLAAFAALHGTTVVAFIQNAALEAAHVTSTKKSSKSSANAPDALWLTDDFGFGDAPEAKEETKAPDLFASVEAKKEAETVAVAPSASASAPAKRGVAGERSQLAKGHGAVWEVRRALGRERVHGLGWSREQLAFVLKLSVVGVRKMEHLGTSPVKSPESRRALLGLAKTLENLGAEIVEYIEREEAALGIAGS